MAMKTLLVALDGSPRAEHVLAAAIDYAKANGAKLVLFRAVGIPADLPFSAMAMSPADVVSGLEQRAMADLNDFARTLPTGVPHEIRVEAGTAWQTICHAARIIDAALIVIGSHGYGGFDRVLGTTASRVVNHADRSVLVVRSMAPADQAAGTK
jgi:nucleotide-binding universal stress UspA family protein